MATDNCPSLFNSTFNGGTKYSPIAVEGPTKKRVSDGMIESASMDIKYELKRAKKLYKKIRYEFHILRFFKRGI